MKVSFEEISDVREREAHEDRDRLYRVWEEHELTVRRAKAALRRAKADEDEAYVAYQEADWRWYAERERVRREYPNAE